MKPIGAPSYDQLLAENQRLRQQLAERPESGPSIHLDLQQERVTLRGLESPSLELDSAEVHLPGMARAVPEMMNVASLIDSKGQAKMPDLAAFQKFPMKVESLRMRLPEQTLNQVLAKTPVEGMSQLRVQVRPEGRLRLSGVAHKLFPIPFEVEGRLTARGGAEVRFRLERTRVAGFLPIPKLMTNLFASLASQEMARMHVRHRGDDFDVDLKGFVPENISVTVDRIRTERGALLIETDSKHPPA